MHSHLKAAAFLATILTIPIAADALAAQGPTGIKLVWTAPGDDSTRGRAARYDLRYAIFPITDSNFSRATQVNGVLAPSPSGSLETVTLYGLGAHLYFFALKTADERGNWSKVSNIATTYWVPLGLGEPAMVISFSIPWPNPARQSCSFSYSLPQAAPIRVDVFDVGGRHVRALASGWREAGQGELVWDLRDNGGRRIGPGMYLVQARLGERSWTRTVTVVS